MAQSRIKGITIELDGETKGLDQALRSVNQRSRELHTELNDVNRLLRFNPGNAELIAQQQRLLAEQVENTTERLNQLRAAQSQVQAQFDSGDLSEEQYRAFQRELIATEGRLEHFQNQLQETGDTAEVTGHNLAELGDSFKGVGEGMKNVGGTMSAAFTAPILGGLALVTESTEELRQDLARLETNALNAGFGVDFMSQQLERINAIAPDANANVEGLSNLMATPMSEQGLAQAVDYLAGAVIRFPETLNFEGLADGLQETFAVGEAAGSFAELLERSGIELEGFNAGLAKAIEAGTAENYILETLANTGLASVNEEFRKNNEELIKNREATLAFQTAMAELGNTLLPIVTAVTEKLAELTDWFNNLDKTQQQNIITAAGVVAAIGPLLVIIGTLITSVGTIISTLASMSAALAAAGGASAVFGSVIAALTGPIGIAVAAVTGLIAIFVALYKNNEEFRTKIKEIWESIKKFFSEAMDFIGNKVVKPIMTEIMSFFSETLGKIQDFWDENGKQITAIAKGFLKIVSAEVKEKMGIIKGIFEVIWPIISGVVKIAWGIIKTVTQTSMDLVLGIIQLALKLIKGDWEGAWETIKQIAIDIMGNIVGFFQDIDLFDIGSDIIQGLIDGLGSMKDAIKGKVEFLASLVPDGLKDFLDINSPSRLIRDQVGKMIPLGLSEGITKNLGAVKQASEKMAQASIPSVPTVKHTSTSTTYGNVYVTIDAKNVQELNNVVDFFKRLPQAQKAW